jgi:hypothetical protein
VLPRKNGLEVNHRAINRGGERVQTKKGSLDQGEVSMVGDGVVISKKWGTCREGGRRTGWKTRRVPNRYDYYREGHRVNRSSGTRAKCSRENSESNR